MTDAREKADIVSRLRKSIETGDVPFYRDEAGQMVWHTDTMEEAATEIASLRRELEEARAEITRCHARLEIEHYFTMGEEGEFVRHEMTMEERLTFPDAVTCRDATIAALQMDIEEARADALEEAAALADSYECSLADYGGSVDAKNFYEAGVLDAGQGIAAGIRKLAEPDVSIVTRKETP